MQKFKPRFFPLVLGGDHSLAIGSVFAHSYCLKQGLSGLLWFDAHPDMNTPKVL